MNILVLDVAASVSGAVTVLKEYYKKALLDKANIYYFCVSVVPLKCNDNVIVLAFPWIKKSWFHRLYFDFFVLKTIILKYEINRVISLQNLIIPFCKIPQIVYLHQAIPFSKYRFSLWREPKLWVYQNVIGCMIFHSLKRADKIIVQTNCMKDTVIRILKIPQGKILVNKPIVTVPEGRRFNKNKFCNRFFYPATGFSYKNHITLYRAAMMLKQAGIKNFEIILTLAEIDLPVECKALHKELGNIVKLVGVLKYEQVVEEYCKSVLVFPSYIETVGMPLIEAREVGAPIISVSEEFSHEILEGYNDVEYFTWNNYKDLSILMKKHILYNEGKE